MAKLGSLLLLLIVALLWVPWSTLISWAKEETAKKPRKDVL